MATIAIVCVAAANGAAPKSGSSIALQMIRGAGVAQPQAIAAAPDGSLWFTNGRTSTIGRIAPSGVVTAFASPDITAPRALAVASDGSVWFSNAAGQVDRLARDGTLRSFAVPSTVPIGGLAAAADGSMWFTQGGEAIGEIAPDGSVHNFSVPEDMRGTQGIAAGPDGAIWFTNYLGASIGRIAADGSVSIYTDTRIRYPSAIVAGRDGALWFADDSGAVGRITTSGAISVYGTAASIGHPDAISVGPDGALWVTGRGGYVARVTTAGAITHYSVAAAGFATGIASAGSSLWVTNYTGSTIVRLALGSLPRHRSTPATSVLAQAKPSSGPALPRVTMISDSVAGAIWFDASARATLAQGVDLFLEPSQGRRLGDPAPTVGGAQAPALQLIPQLGRKLGPTVIMFIGDNDYYADDAQNVASAMAELRQAGVSRVIWVTLHLTPDHTSYAFMNDAIRAAAAADPAHISVVDWNAYSSPHPEWFQPDGVHLLGGGPHALAQLLRSALVKLRIPRA